MAKTHFSLIKIWLVVLNYNRPPTGATVTLQVPLLVALLLLHIQPATAVLHAKVIPHIPAQAVDCALTAVGATSDDTKGKAIIIPSPTFLITSRRDIPAKLETTSSPLAINFSFY